MSDFRPIRTPLAQRLEDFRRGPLPLLVWLLAVGSLGLLFSRQTGQLQFVGLARARQSEISSPGGGHLSQLLVDLYQDVEAGQVVARLDDALLKAQMETLQATVAQIRKQLDSEREKLRLKDKAQISKSQADLADLRATEDKRHLDALAIKTEIETDRVDQQRLDLEVGRLKKLLEVRAISQQEFDNLKLQRDAIARRIAENTTRLTQTEGTWASARRQREGLGAQLPEAIDEEVVLQPIRESIRVQELALAELSIQRGATLLRAPVAGRVVQLACQAGQAVTPGEPIMIIGERVTSEVIGYMSEAAPQDVHENMRVEVARAVQPEVSAAALVSRISPALEPLPAHLWPDGNHPRYGRPFIVSLRAPLPLVPGEKIVIRATRPATK